MRMLDTSSTISAQRSGRAYVDSINVERVDFEKSLALSTFGRFPSLLLASPKMSPDPEVRRLCLPVWREVR